MRFRKFGIVMCFADTGLLVAAAPANAAPSNPSAPHAARTLSYAGDSASTTATLDPGSPQAAKDELARIQRAGGTILGISHSDTHDFQAVTNGEVLTHGTTYEAAAYDIIKKVKC
jgi:hypothetical protein